MAVYKSLQYLSFKSCGCGGVEKEIMVPKWLIFLNMLPIKAKVAVLDIYMTVQCKHAAWLKPTAQPQERVCADYELTTCYLNSYLLASKHFVYFENEMSWNTFKSRTGNYKINVNNLTYMLIATKIFFGFILITVQRCMFTFACPSQNPIWININININNNDDDNNNNNNNW